MLRRLPPFLLAVALFGLVLGVKLDVLNHYGSDLPRWDQLDAEGLAVYVPLAQGQLSAADLFRPHNEHRIFWTKLLGLAELKLNGQWDARLQCAINAALHALFALAIFMFARRGIDRAHQPPLYALIALFIALPLAWENPLAGFHSQQYLLLGFSFAALVLLPLARPWSPAWWSGALFLFASLFTMGSGLFAAAIALGVIGLSAWLGQDFRGGLQRSLPTWITCVAALGAGAALHVSVNYHDGLKARSVADFVRYAIHCLQWPATSKAGGFLALVFWLPFAWLAVHVVRRRPAGAEARFPLLVLGLGAWVLLQIAATAYARGADGGMPSSRYGDTLAFGLIVNGIALFWLVPRLESRPLRTLIAVTWTAAVLVCVGLQCRELFTNTLPSNRSYLQAAGENTRRYIATGDSSHLVEPDLPYPGVRALRERIDLPELRAILPVSVREPIALTVGEVETPFVLRDTVKVAGRFQPSPAALPAGPDALAELPVRRVWAADPTRTPGAWQSREFLLKHDTVLRFLVAGHADTTLTVERAGDRRRLDVDLSRLAPDRWNAVHLAVPAGSYRLSAAVAERGRWLAFAEPVEMAPGSHRVWLAVRQGRKIWVTSLVLALAAWVCAMGCGRAEKSLSCTPTVYDPSA